MVFSAIKHIENNECNFDMYSEKNSRMKLFTQMPLLYWLCFLLDIDMSMELPFLIEENIH